MIRWLSLVVLFCCTGCATIDRGLPLLAREHPERFIVVTVRNDEVPASTRAGSLTSRSKRYGQSGSGYGAGWITRPSSQPDTLPV